MLPLTATARGASSKYDIVLGLVSVHFYNPDNVGRRFKNKMDSDGVAVATPLLGLRAYHMRPKDYTYLGGFGGLNSVGRPMAGVLGGMGIRHKTFRIGAVLGAYIQSNKRFREAGVEPYAIYQTSGKQGVVPVSGMEIMIDVNRKVFTNVMLSPIVGNVGVGYRF
jgi:hypothetical protein